MQSDKKICGETELSASVACNKRFPMIDRDRLATPHGGGVFRRYANRTPECGRPAKFGKEVIERLHAGDDTIRNASRQDETYRTFCNEWGMKEPYERLEMARLRAGYATPTDAARAFGWNEITYRAHESGGRGLRRDVADRYAKAFKTTAAWLLTGQGPETKKHAVSVMGRIGAGAEILPEFEQLPPEGLYEIETLVPVPDGSIAFEVEGDSMWPRYDPGDVIVCWREGNNFEEVVGWEAAVRTQDGRRYLKRILKGSSPGTFDLESHNGPPIRGVKLDWVAHVGMVVRAGQWNLLASRERTQSPRKGRR